MTIGKQWKREALPLDAIKEHKTFQWRVLGRDPVQVNSILRTLEAGEEARDPIRVARVGNVLYVVDGFHRLEAYRRAGRPTIPAEVAKMSLEDAKAFSQASNALNGKPYGRADKDRLWTDFLASGRHRDPFGNLKSSRTIAAELPGRFYSHETVRKKLRAEGLELDEEVEFPGGYTPYGSQATEAELLADLACDAVSSLRDFGTLIADLDPEDRDRLLQAARGIIAAAEKGERPDLAAILGEPTELLDI